MITSFSPVSAASTSAMPYDHHHEHEHEHQLESALVAFPNWTTAKTNPISFLHAFQKAAYLHPVLYTIPSLHLVRSHAYLILGDIHSALRHQLEAQRLVATSHEPQDSLFISFGVSQLSLVLAITARALHHDPLLCLSYLDRATHPHFRMAVRMHSAQCLLILGYTDSALTIYMDLATITQDPDLVLVCARLHAILGQFPSIYTTLETLKSLSPSHPGINDLQAILDAQVNHYLVQVSTLSYRHRYHQVLDIVHKGLELSPSHTGLLSSKAETLVQTGNITDAISFIGTCSLDLRSNDKVDSLLVQCLESQLHHEWSMKNYTAAVSTLSHLCAARRQPNPRDKLWQCQLSFLRQGPSAPKLANDLEVFLHQTSQDNASLITEYDIGLAQGMLCQVYAYQARQLASTSDSPQSWRSAIRLLDKAIPLSYPRIPGLGDPSLPPFPALLSTHFPLPLPVLDTWPKWATELPETDRAGALWLTKSHVLDQCADSPHAIAAARAALILSPSWLEAKQWLLHLTQDQNELAELAAYQVSVRWATTLTTEKLLTSESRSILDHGNMDKMISPWRNRQQQDLEVTTKIDTMMVPTTTTKSTITIGSLVGIPTDGNSVADVSDSVMPNHSDCDRRIPTSLLSSFPNPVSSSPPDKCLIPRLGMSLPPGITNGRSRSHLTMIKLPPVLMGSRAPVQTTTSRGEEKVRSVEKVENMSSVTGTTHAPQKQPSLDKHARHLDIHTEVSIGLTKPSPSDDLDVATLARNGKAAALYVTRAVEEAAIQSVVQSHQSQTAREEGTAQKGTTRSTKQGVDRSQRPRDKREHRDSNHRV